MSPALSQLLQRLPEPIKADPKKTGVLAALLGVLAIFCVRAATQRATPERAGASFFAAAGAGEGNGSQASAAVRHNASSISALAARDSWLASPAAGLSRNLFQVSLDRFRPAPHTSDMTGIPTEEGFWDRVAKSQTVQADQLKRREAAIESAQRLAANLKLRSTVMGAEPKAIIDDKVVQVGMTVSSFRVMKIEPRKVIVERDGVRLEIRMEQ